MSRVPRLSELLWRADPRLPMIIVAWHAALFGASLLGGEIVDAFRASSSTERQVYEWFGLLPPIVVAVVFVISAACVVRGVVDGRRREVRRACLVLLGAWVYVWLAIPVANLFQGVVLDSAFGRYTSPIPVAWWAFTRAAYSAGWLGPAPPTRRAGTPVAAAVVVPTAIVAVVDAVLLQTEAVPASQILEPALWTAVGVILTAVLGYLGNRYASKKDLDKEMGSVAFEHTQFLFGQYGTHLGEVRAELEHTRGQLSEALRREEARDHFCRNHCNAYPPPLS